MESFKTKLFANNLIKSILEIKCIWIGHGKESVDKLFVFMAKKIKKLDKQRRKKYKVV